jgi:outer membrane protein OmpA-like peptidoglycan-associated protein
MDQRRADAIVAHLVQRGVKRDRLVAKGYGFAKLTNHCVPGVPCSEEEHAKNRRVEYTVTEIVP